MNHHANDERVGEGWDVTQCECGELTLRLGTIRLDFSPDEFARLHRLIEGAVEQFQPGAPPAVAPRSKSFMH